MDNFHINVVCEGDDVLRLAIALAFRGQGLEQTNPKGRRRGATHYAVRQAAPPKSADDVRSGIERPKPLRLVFHEYLSDPPHDNREDLVRLPFTLDADGAADFARRWLAEADYGREPDHDGDNGRGWRVYVDEWGRVDGDHGSIVAVAPAWAMYGK